VPAISRLAVRSNSDAAKATAADTTERREAETFLPFSEIRAIIGRKERVDFLFAGRQKGDMTWPRNSRDGRINFLAGRFSAALA
jgi:hypothetical protein